MVNKDCHWKIHELVGFGLTSDESFRASYTLYKSQLLQTDPRDAPLHAYRIMHKCGRLDA